MLQFLVLSVGWGRAKGQRFREQSPEVGYAQSPQRRQQEAGRCVLSSGEELEQCRERLTESNWKHPTERTALAVQQSSVYQVVVCQEPGTELGAGDGTRHRP